jgi:protease-4
MNDEKPVETPVSEPKEAPALANTALGATKNVANETQDACREPGWERATLEKMAFAFLAEQRASRRWRNFVRLAWLAFFAVLAWSLLSHGGPSTDKPCRTPLWWKSRAKLRPAPTPAPSF